MWRCRKHFAAATLALAACLASCRRATGHREDQTSAQLLITQLPMRIYSNSSQDEISIRSWCLIGPYEFPATGANPGSDGSVESKSSLCRYGQGATVAAQNGQIFNIDKVFPGLTNSVLYAATVIESPVDGDIGFQYDATAGVQVWFNGSLVDEQVQGARHPVFLYTNFKVLHVSKGDNLLVLKLSQQQGGPAFEPWAFVSGFLSVGKMRNILLDTRDGFLISDRFINRGESLNVGLLRDPSTLGGSSKIIITVKDWSGGIKFRETQRVSAGPIISLPPLKEGYYRLTFEAQRHRIEDSFYVGDPHRAIRALQIVQSHTEHTRVDYLQSDPIIQRFDILMSQKYAMPSDSNWQKKVLMVIDEAIAAAQFRRQMPWYTRPGQHLREFNSRIDGSRQYYLIDIPKGPKAKLPLVIVMPYAISTQRPFLESSLISYSTVLEEVREAANESHLAVAIIYGRGTVGDAPIGEADALEVIYDISHHYPVDERRLYLYGICAGGRRAIALAEHYPSLFAAVGAWGPSLKAEAGDGGWRDDPFRLTDRLADTPLVLLKGALDEDLPDQMLIDFADKVRKEGDGVYLAIVANAMHDPIRMEQVIFPRLASARRRGRHAALSLYLVQAIDAAKFEMKSKPDDTIATPRP